MPLTLALGMAKLLPLVYISGLPNTPWPQLNTPIALASLWRDYHTFVGIAIIGIFISAFLIGAALFRLKSDLSKHSIGLVDSIVESFRVLPSVVTGSCMYLLLLMLVPLGLAILAQFWTVSSPVLTTLSLIWVSYTSITGIFYVALIVQEPKISGTKAIWKSLCLNFGQWWRSATVLSVPTSIILLITLLGSYVIVTQLLGIPASHLLETPIFYWPVEASTYLMLFYILLTCVLTPFLLAVYWVHCHDLQMRTQGRRDALARME